MTFCDQRSTRKVRFFPFCVQNKWQSEFLILACKSVILSSFCIVYEFNLILIQMKISNSRNHKTIKYITRLILFSNVVSHLITIETTINTHVHTHTHTHTYMFRASRGDHQSILEFFTYFRGLCYSSGRAITELSQSEDLRHLSVCREREISHKEKKGRNPD